MKTVKQMIQKMLETMKTKDLAQRFGVNRSTIYRWKKGISEPNPKNYSKIERYFNNYFNFDFVVVYGIVRGIHDHDRYKSLEIAFCVPHGSFSPKEINEIINDVAIAHGNGYLAVDPYHNSYDVVGINEEYDRPCDIVLRSYREIYNFIEEYLKREEEKKYWKNKYKRLDSEWKNEE